MILLDVALMCCVVDAGPDLDPLSEQTPYAPALLKSVQMGPAVSWLRGAPERLKKHYQLFRTFGPR